MLGIIEKIDQTIGGEGLQSIVYKGAAAYTEAVLQKMSDKTDLDDATERITRLGGRTSRASIPSKNPSLSVQK